MPVLKSAIKKLKQAKARAKRNSKVRRKVKELVDTFKKNVSLENYSKAVSALDKAVKTGVIHKNKASRLKSRLSKRLPKIETKVVPKKSSKKKTT